MKKFLAVLLCVLTVFGAVACKEKDTDESGNPDVEQGSGSETNQGNENGGNTENPKPEGEPQVPTENSAFSDYEDILNALRVLATEGGQAKFEAEHSLKSEREQLIFGEICDLSFSALSYCIKDLNGDGATELILRQKDTDKLRALFTLHEGKPIFLQWFSDGNHEGGIGADGTVYRAGYSKGESWYRDVMRISGDTLVGLSYAYIDDDPDDEQVEYSKTVDGVTVKLTKEELEELAAEHDAIFSDLVGVTASAGLTFTPVLSEDASDWEAVLSNTHYKIFKKSLTYRYEIYDKNGKKVRSAEATGPLTISMIGEDVVDIQIGYGTGISGHTYYSVTEDIFSEEYTYVVASTEERVAYLTGGLSDRVLVVRDLFDESGFSQTYELDFTPTDTPVTEARFSEDGKSLEVAFVCGAEERNATKTICFEDMLMLKTLKSCYVRTDTVISPETILRRSNGKADILRPETEDTVRLLCADPILGDTYTTSEGELKSAWYKIEYRGQVCYVTADSFAPFVYYADENVAYRARIRPMLWDSLVEREIAVVDADGDGRIEVFLRAKENAIRLRWQNGEVLVFDEDSRYDALAWQPLNAQTIQAALPCAVTVADFANYESILTTFREIVKLYETYSDQKDRYGMYDDLFFFPDAEAREWYNGLFVAGFLFQPLVSASDEHVYAQDGNNQYGYAIKDLNGDGVDELVLLTDSFDLLALFTMKDGKPVLLRTFMPRGAGWIDEGGRLHVYAIGGASGSESFVYEIADGELRLLTCIGYEWDYEQYHTVYYKVVDGEKIAITQGEWVELDTRYALLTVDFRTQEYTKSKAGLQWQPLFEATKPNQTHDTTWQHEFLDGGTWLNVTSLTEEEILFYLVVQKKTEADVLNGVATLRDGVYVVEADGFCGRLEFCRYGIWLIVEESNNEALPCRAYLINVVVRGKG